MSSVDPAVFAGRDSITATVKWPEGINNWLFVNIVTDSIFQMDFRNGIRTASILLHDSIHTDDGRYDVLFKNYYKDATGKDTYLQFSLHRIMVGAMLRTGN